MKSASAWIGAVVRVVRVGQGRVGGQQAQLPWGQFSVGQERRGHAELVGVGVGREGEERRMLGLPAEPTDGVVGGPPGRRHARDARRRGVVAASLPGERDQIAASGIVSIRPSPNSGVVLRWATIVACGGTTSPTKLTPLNSPIPWLWISGPPNSTMGSYTPSTSRPNRVTSRSPEPPVPPAVWHATQD